MIKNEVSVVINKPIAEVFEFLTNIENNPQWQSSTVEAKRTSEGAVGIGSTSVVKVHFLGRKVEATTEVTEYEPHERIGWKITSGPVPANGSTIFEPIAEGETKVTLLAEYDVGGFFKLAEPLVARAIKRAGDTDAATLKDILEARS